MKEVNRESWGATDKKEEGVVDRKESEETTIVERRSISSHSLSSVFGFEISIFRIQL